MQRNRNASIFEVWSVGIWVILKTRVVGHGIPELPYVVKGASNNPFQENLWMASVQHMEHLVWQQDLLGALQDGDRRPHYMNSDACKCRCYICRLQYGHQVSVTISGVLPGSPQL